MAPRADMDDFDAAEDCLVPLHTTTDAGSGPDASRGIDPEDTDGGGRPCYTGDAPGCIRACKEQFLTRISPDYSKTFGNVCTSLSKDGGHQDLWHLYWCDSVYCGVWIDREGQDPNVDLIINTCQNIGYPAVDDPGPPPSDYRCRRGAGDDLGMPCQAFVDTTQTARVSGLTEGPVTTSTITASHEPQSTSSQGPGISAGSTNGAASPASGSGSSGEPPVGVKVGIGICAAIGLALVACLALFLLRRRRSARSSYHRRLKAHIRHPHDFSGVPGDSPSPLISPANSAASGSGGGGATVPLTPPLRLRDRRLLPSMLRTGGRSSSPPLTSLSPPHSPTQIHPSAGVDAFPSSPICVPTTHRLAPRHERIPKVYGLPRPRAATTTGPRSSFGSLAASGSTTANSSLRNEIATATSSYATAAALRTPSASASTSTPPCSPARPARPHEEPLEIPDLVTPLHPHRHPPVVAVAAHTTQHSPTSPSGPPPRRALPVPPQSLTSASLASSQGYHHDQGHARPAQPQEPTLPPSYSAATTATAGAKGDSQARHLSSDLRELTEEYARERRQSWRGSWATGGGVMGGGAPGVLPRLPPSSSSSSPAAARRGGSGSSRTNYHPAGASSRLLSSEVAYSVGSGRQGRHCSGGSGAGGDEDEDEDEDRASAAPAPALLQEEDLESLGGRY